MTQAELTGKYRKIKNLQNHIEIDVLSEGGRDALVLMAVLSHARRSERSADMFTASDELIFVMH